MIHKHPSVCCLWNYGAKLHLNRRQICNFPCYSTPLISDQRYLTVIQSEQARSHVCVHMYEQALPLCHFQRCDTRAHTCPGSVSEGIGSSTFPLHQSLLPYPLSHQACPVLLQQEICSPVLLLQNCMCVSLHMCVCVFACSPVKQLPRSDSLLSAWHAWTSGFIVCFEFRSGRWEQHSLNWSAIFPRRLACVASWMLFFFSYEHNQKGRS